ncbi:MAG: DinB family protein [Ktedonobacterales bacterium]
MSHSEPTEPTTHIDKATFLATLRRERAAWDALLAEASEMGEARMSQPGVNGAWSVKDIVAHVTWYEREMVGMLRTRALDGSTLWELSHDQRNMTLFEQHRDQPLAAVLADARQTFADLVTLVKGLAEEDLHDASRYRAMPPDWIPWELLADNSYTHYPQHTQAVRAWLDQQ